MIRNEKKVDVKYNTGRAMFSTFHVEYYNYKTKIILIIP